VLPPLPFVFSSPAPSRHGAFDTGYMNMYVRSPAASTFQQASPGRTLHQHHHRRAKLWTPRHAADTNGPCPHPGEAASATSVEIIGVPEQFAEKNTREIARTKPSRPLPDRRP